MSVPFVVFEEHHEALLVWHWAVDQGWIPRNGNILLHVDEHPDMSLPRLRTPISQVDPNDTQAFSRWVYEEIDLSQFIWPAAYLGYLAEVVWLRYKPRVKLTTRPMLIWPSNPKEPTEFLTCIRRSPILPSESKDFRELDFTTVSPFSSLDRGPLILDIDLDFFSSNYYPAGGGRLEVTAEAFREFSEDAHHFLRLTAGVRVRAEQVAGRYFLVFNDVPVEPDCEEEEVPHRIDRFQHFLEKNEIRPTLVTCCRSHKSGFMPGQRLEQIEREVIEVLRRLYDLEDVRLPENYSFRPVPRACVNKNT